MGKKWIAEAHLKAGALTNWIKARIGDRGFTGAGTIRVSVLRAIKAGKKIGGVVPSAKTIQRAQTAINLKKLKRR
jgi:hypothetical protein